MTGVKRNIAVNFLGQAWVSVMGFAFLPVYIGYLGIEAYGLIGLFAVMQAWLTLLDLGMTPTLNREMARFTAGVHTAHSIRDLLRSLELVCFYIAGAIALAIWAMSSWLASDWLKADKLPIDVVASSISIMAFVVALRFVEGVYRGALFGLQRQVWYNGASALLATVRQLGAVAILAWVSPSIKAFFVWQAIFSLLTVIVFAIAVHRALPKIERPARFSRKAIADVWQFAGGMLGITFLAILLTQVDKLLLSKLLTLEFFGYYTLAATITSIFSMAAGPITQAVYPRFVEHYSRAEKSQLVSLYHESAQLVSILITPLLLLLVFYADVIVFMWTGNADLARNVAPILRVLALGTFLNTLMHVPSFLQLSYGWTSLGVKNNIVAVIIFIPGIMWVVPHFGAVGAAWMWVALNAGYILISLQFMHARILPEEKLRWYFSDVLLPFSGAAAVVALLSMVQPEANQGRWLWAAYLAAVGALSFMASTLCAALMRRRISGLLSGVRRKSD